MSKDYLARAFAAFLREPGAVQPSGSTSRIEDTPNGREYAVLRNASGILAVYRIQTNQRLKRLKRWPSAIKEHA